MMSEENAFVKRGRLERIKEEVASFGYSVLRNRNEVENE